MFNRYKDALEWFQEKSRGHPLTCFNGHNLKCKSVEDTTLNLYCEFCDDYHQKYEGEWILNSYTENYLKVRKLKVKLFFRWYDLWIGAYIDIKNDSLYIIPFPMLGIKIYWYTPSMFEKYFRGQKR